MHTGFSTDALLFLVMLAQACASWPIRADWETEGEYSAAAVGGMRKHRCFMTTIAFKPIVGETQEEIVPEKCCF